MRKTLLHYAASFKIVKYYEFPREIFTRNYDPSLYGRYKSRLREIQRARLLN